MALWLEEEEPAGWLFHAGSANAGPSELGSIGDCER